VPPMLSLFLATPFTFMPLAPSPIAQSLRPHFERKATHHTIVTRRGQEDIFQAVEWLAQPPRRRDAWHPWNNTRALAEPTGPREGLL
jgi:hypothetical protein